MSFQLQPVTSLFFLSKDERTGVELKIEELEANIGAIAKASCAWMGSHRLDPSIKFPETLQISMDSIPSISAEIDRLRVSLEALEELEYLEKYGSTLLDETSDCLPPASSLETCKQSIPFSHSETRHLRELSNDLDRFEQYLAMQCFIPSAIPDSLPRTSSGISTLSSEASPETSHPALSGSSAVSLESTPVFSPDDSSVVGCHHDRMRRVNAALGNALKLDFLEN